jgi:predicted anti-sigma-YlaC factor YlaD
MKDINCEDILIQKLALLDGERSEFSAEQIAAHLADCANCREQIEELENTSVLLKRQKRREQSADLWSAIEKEIGAERETTLTVKWQPFVLLGIFLVIYKLLEMIPERDLGWALKLVPFILVAAVFVLIKENPFKINTELILEK